MTQTLTIVPKGPFELERLANFGFGQRHDEAFDGVMRLAFCLDEYQTQAGVEVRQDVDGVHCVVVGEADLRKVQLQVERVLSLDYDGEEFMKVGRRDPVIGRLQELAPGLRPPLFYSPYEAAAWSIISARRPALQMARVRDQLNQAHGRSFDLGGKTSAAFPLPQQILDLKSFPGVSDEKVERLHGVAVAALDGALSVDKIKAQEPHQAMLELQQIKGIGPFYSALIVIRASGLANILPENEPKSLELIKQLYGLSALPSPEQLQALAVKWDPFQTWATVLIRAIGPQLLKV